MIFKSISIKEGMEERTVTFSKGVNLIFSRENSKGKTTLLRLMLYSLGYNIPSTRKMKFEQCEVITKIYCDKLGDIVLSRFNSTIIEMEYNGEKTTYILPDQLHDIQRIIFDTDSTDVLDNILGAIYADQEKGWTLLNRGTAIGSIHFNIEELIRGLSGCDCSELIQKERQLANELRKYRQMYSVAKYRESIVAESNTLVSDDYAVESDAVVSQLMIQQNTLQNELKRIDKTLTDNRRFRHYVEEMKLMVQSPDGSIIPVTAENIVGLSDTIDYLLAKRKMISSDLQAVMRQLSNMQKEQNEEAEQLAFFQSESLIEIFDKKIVAVPIDVKAVNKEITHLETALKAIRKKISTKTMSNTEVIMSLYKNMIKYASELGIGNSESITSSYLFTSNLKELSGAVLHKTVFAFRLAYIIEIEKFLDIKLPIILDSPSGKEVDQTNIQLMVNILKRDFSNNQIIIASIFQYDFESVTLIEIKNRLVE